MSLKNTFGLLSLISCIAGFVLFGWLYNTAFNFIGLVLGGISITFAILGIIKDENTSLANWSLLIGVFLLGAVIYHMIFGVGVII
ncbi:MAG: hypothetical protein ACFFCS_23375 [Candidatus Hodarchaeota archaeon]